MFCLTGNSMLDETMVIIVSDHGGYQKHHGFCDGPNKECQSFTMTATMNVPMLIRGNFFHKLKKENVNLEETERILI